MSKKTHIVLAHPYLERSRHSKALIEVSKQLNHVTTCDLYATYPDMKIDVKKEQDRLVQAERVVFMFPLYWYSSPAFLKQYQDDVLTYGFAYGSTGTALHGKEFLIATSSGGPQNAYVAGGYNHFTMSELLRPFQATANLCGMQYATPFVIHGAMQTTEQDIKASQDKWMELISK